MTKLAELTNEETKCDCCHEVIKDKTITISSFTLGKEINLCVNCFMGMTAEKLNFLKCARFSGR